MQSLTYQRTIIGYHGCDREVVENVLLRRDRLKPSKNKHDWLGIQVVVRDSGCILGYFLPAS